MRFQTRWIESGCGYVGFVRSISGIYPGAVAVSFHQLVCPDAKPGRGIGVDFGAASKSVGAKLLFRRPQMNNRYLPAAHPDSKNPKIYSSPSPLPLIQTSARPAAAWSSVSSSSAVSHLPLQAGTVQAEDRSRGSYTSDSSGVDMLQIRCARRRALGGSCRSRDPYRRCRFSAD